MSARSIAANRGRGATTLGRGGATASRRLAPVEESVVDEPRTVSRSPSRSPPRTQRRGSASGGLALAQRVARKSAGGRGRAVKDTGFTLQSLVSELSRQNLNADQTQQVIRAALTRAEQLTGRPILAEENRVRTGRRSASTKSPRLSAVERADFLEVPAALPIDPDVQSVNERRNKSLRSTEGQMTIQELSDNIPLTSTTGGMTVGANPAANAMIGYLTQSYAANRNLGGFEQYRSKFPDANPAAAAGLESLKLNDLKNFAKSQLIPGYSMLNKYLLAGYLAALGFSAADVSGTVGTRN